MSTALPPRPRNISNSKARISIVASKYNEEFTNALVENAKDELAAIMPHARVDVVRVPGAFEIPVACAAVLAGEEKPQAVIALGLIIRGKTQHGDLVAESVSTSLQEMAVKHVTPVIHEVLLVEDEKQAYARCIGSQLNRGREAARAAESMVELFAKLKHDPDSKKKLNRQFPSNA
ncbi:6,7-dimethyl-8-ribityllumazine synthase [Rubritalea halochordaticola]|uniref:6,7-dimethyl-8-ribityllumazine synthase n=1 Tax=Rubritalea halochordaticola TaxID=714537 RepID=A0ABP9UWH9_9BACT